MVTEKRDLFFSFYFSFLVLLQQQHANRQRVVKDRHKFQKRTDCKLTQHFQKQQIVGLPNSVQPLSFWFTSDAELDIIAHSKGLWSASQSRKMEKHLSGSLTALDEPKLRPHCDDLQENPTSMFL